MKKVYDTIVIGSGLIGTLTARMLAKSNERVAIIDRQIIGKESSWAGGGILSPLYPWRYPEPVTKLARWGHENYKKFSNELFQETGIDPEYLNSGLLILDSIDEYPQASKWADDYSIPMQLLDENECREIEPLASNNTQSGIWLPEVAQMRNPRLMKSMKRSLEINNIDVYENCEILAINQLRNKAVGCSSADAQFSAEKIIVTSGAWSAPLLKTTGLNLSVEPVLGQMILFNAKALALKRIVLSKDRYIIPRKDGRVLVGSTLEHVGFNKKTTQAAKIELLAEAQRIIPELENYPIEHHWAGLRPGSPQGVPYVAEHPEISNLYINTGHYRNGVILGLASVNLLLDIIFNRDSVFEKSDYQDTS